MSAEPGQPAPSIRSRVARTLAPASVGALLGYLYARSRLSPELMETSSLPGLYTSAGAALAILALRTTTLFRSILKELWSSRAAKRPPSGG